MELEGGSGGKFDWLGVSFQVAESCLLTSVCVQLI